MTCRVCFFYVGWVDWMFGGLGLFGLAVRFLGFRVVCLLGVNGLCLLWFILVCFLCVCLLLVTVVVYVSYLRYDFVFCWIITLGYL